MSTPQRSCLFRQTRAMQLFAAATMVVLALIAATLILAWESNGRCLQQPAPIMMPR